MKKNLIICLVTFLSVQASEAPTLQVSAQAEIAQNLKKAHDELRTLKAQLTAILTIVLKELKDFEITRNIDFNAYNNLQDEYSKYQDGMEDIEEEGDED